MTTAPRLRQSAIERIFHTPIQASSRFELSDFSIDQSVTTINEDQFHIIEISIIYRPSPDYYFKCEYSVKWNPPVTWELAPGKLFTTEDGSSNHIDDTSSAITNWLGDLWREISSGPVSRHIKSVNAKIDQLIEQIESSEDGEFTDKDILEYEGRIKALEDLLATHIETQQLEQSQNEAELKQLRRDIEFLQTTLHTMTKKGWLISFASKVGKWVASEHGSEALTEAFKLARKALPPSDDNDES